MQSQLYQQTAFQIHQLKIKHASGMIDGRAYIDGRARILDHYMGVTDRHGNLSLTMNRLQRLKSFSPFLGPQEVWDEEQRMWRQSQQPPPIAGWPMSLGPARIQIPLLPSVFRRESLQQERVQLPPPHGLPATVTPKQYEKQYEAIHPGIDMVLKDARAFLDGFFLPHQQRSKGGGKNGTLMFCCHHPACTLRCRLVPVPLSDPPLYKAEVKIGCNKHTNHKTLEVLPAIQLPPPPATAKPKQYEAIPPGIDMVLKDAKAFLVSFFLPHQKRSKGGGQNGMLMFCCYHPACTLRCRLVPVYLSDPPVYKAEVKVGFSEHTNHTALEDLQAQQSARPIGKSKDLMLSDEVKLYIDQLVELNPKMTAVAIMGCLEDHPPFANRPFLQTKRRRDDTQRQVRWHQTNTLISKRKKLEQHQQTVAEHQEK
jgi:hypothetical protein